MALINRNTIESYTLLEEDGLETGKADYYWHKAVKLFNIFKVTDYKYTKTINISKCNSSKKLGFK